MNIEIQKVPGTKPRLKFMKDIIQKLLIFLKFIIILINISQSLIFLKPVVKTLQSNLKKNSMNNRKSIALFSKN